jgi:hypothetical protein
MFRNGMKDLQAPVSHVFSPDGVRPIFNHIPPGFRRAAFNFGQIFRFTVGFVAPGWIKTD